MARLVLVVGLFDSEHAAAELVDPEAVRHLPQHAAQLLEALVRAGIG